MSASLAAFATDAHQASHSASNTDDWSSPRTRLRRGCCPAGGLTRLGTNDSCFGRSVPTSRGPRSPAVVGARTGESTRAIGRTRALLEPLTQFVNFGSLVRDLDMLHATIDEIRDHAHTLGATQIVATMPTADGEAIIDYRPGDWLKITVVGEREPLFILPPDWTGQ